MTRVIDQDRKTNKRERRGEREHIPNGQLLVSVSTLLRFAPICDERARVRTIVPAEFYEPRDRSLYKLSKLSGGE